MANIDIISRLKSEEMTITVAEGKTYTVDCGAETMLKAQEIFKKTNNGIDSLFEVIKLLLGATALKEIKNMKPTVNQLKVISLAVMAQVQEVPFEEMEKRFQN